jgi:hypothetical protein
LSGRIILNFFSIFSVFKQKSIASILCVIAAISFVASGICVLIGHSWHNRDIIVATATSSILFIAFWDGSKKKLHTQGAIAILINIAILVYTLI